jgi:4-hydroxybenzoate polyprenyltransferase
MTWIRLFRLPNVLIVVIAMFGARAILFDAFGKFPFDIHFWLLTLASGLIMAAGNLLNDYFDQSIDQINKPNRSLVGKQISENKIISIYLIINALAIVLGSYVRHHLEQNSWITILYPSVILALYLYNRWLKCTPLLGNLVVATLCGLIPLQVFWLLGSETALLPNAIPLSLKYYVGFAFLLTLWREVVKDLEDQKGDKACHCNTIPILFGEKVGRNYARFIGICTVAALGFMIYTHTPASRQIPFLVAILTPSCIAIYWLFQTGHSVFYEKASTIIKILMLIGLFALAM